MKRWKPKSREKYYCIFFHIVGSETGEIVREYYEDNKREHTDRFKCGNCFRTRREAQAKLNAIRKLLKSRT